MAQGSKMAGMLASHPRIRAGKLWPANQSKAVEDYLLKAEATSGGSALWDGACWAHFQVPTKTRDAAFDGLVQTFYLISSGSSGTPAAQ